MKMASRLILIFLFLVNIKNGFSCSLRQDLVSLSGPVTMLLEKLDLLSDKRLKAVSKFHLLEKDFNKEVLAGGIFLSKRTLERFKNHFVIYDQSRELTRELQNHHEIKSLEIKTVGQNPFETVDFLLDKISFLLKSCDKKIASLNSTLEKIKTNLKVPTGTYLFFLGKIGYKYPDLIITNDGFVKSLKLLKGFKTYPSELGYTPWSKKMRSRINRPIEIGILEKKLESPQVKLLKNRKLNIAFRGIMIPGIRQIELLKYLSSKEFQSYVN